jgi:hypothetical protein
MKPEPNEVVTFVSWTWPPLNVPLSASNAPIVLWFSRDTSADNNSPAYESFDPVPKQRFFAGSAPDIRKPWSRR